MNPYGVQNPPPDLIEIARWNHANQRARNAYHGAAAGTPEQQSKARAKAARKAEAQRAYRARKKEQK